jgi:hypothetical protein
MYHSYSLILEIGFLFLCSSLDIKLIMLDYTGLRLLYYHETIDVIFAHNYHKWYQLRSYFIVQAGYGLPMFSFRMSMYTNDMPQFTTYPINKDLTTVIDIK